jgi:hypothetical protein
MKEVVGGYLAPESEMQAVLRKAAVGGRMVAA